MVKDLRELDKYSWTGHSAILGRRKNPLIPYKPPDSGKRSDDTKNKSAIPNSKSETSLAERTTQDVLLHFGDTLKIARERYRQFIKNGIRQGSRPELQGGGLIRSAGGEKRGLVGRKKEEMEKGDERILGSGDFVIHALNRANEPFEKSDKNPISLDELIKRVTKDRKIDLKDLLSSKRTQEISNTRAIISYLAAIELRNSGTKIASQLRLSEKSVSRCIERGKKLLDKHEKLIDYLQ